jgi:hypothetical protein
MSPGGLRVGDSVRIERDRIRRHQLYTHYWTTQQNPPPQTFTAVGNVANEFTNEGKTP